MGLADTRWSEQDHVPLLLDEAERGEFSDERAVERGLEVEVELAQRFVHRVVGETETPSCPPRFSSGNLDVEQGLKDLGCGQLLLECAVELRAEVLSGGGQTQVGKVFAKTLVAGRLSNTHDTTS